MDFKQWDFVSLREGASGYIDGLTVSEDLYTVIWKDGMITHTNLLEYMKWGKKFDLYEALLNSKNLKREPKYILDNLTFIEIFAKLREHEQKLGRV